MEVLEIRCRPQGSRFQGGSQQMHMAAAALHTVLSQLGSNDPAAASLLGKLDYHTSPAAAPPAPPPRANSYASRGSEKKRPHSRGGGGVCAAPPPSSRASGGEPIEQAAPALAVVPSTPVGYMPQLGGAALGLHNLAGVMVAFGPFAGGAANMPGLSQLAGLPAGTQLSVNMAGQLVVHGLAPPAPAAPSGNR